jgi:chaperone modulatory protein CbpM
MRLDAVVTLFPALSPDELLVWIERRWVEPDVLDGGELHFHEIDVARVRLVYELRHELEVGEDTLPLVLSLLDQVYETRSRLKAVVDAIDRQPPEVRRRILAAIGAG